MPELPEVQTVVNTLRPWLLNRRILSVKLTRTDIIDPPGTDLPGLLAGRKIDDISRRGKRIIFTLDNTHRFFIHLGMTGRLNIGSLSEPSLAHTHLTIDLAEANANRQQLRFSDPRRFGGIWWLGDGECDAGMGPEPLTIRSAQLGRQLARTSRAVKTALLDQSIVAGLGNIYVDESLFAAKIHPLTPSNRVTPAQIASLNRAIKSTLRKAINYRGSTLRDYRDADGTPGGFQKLHRVYDRGGKPCMICKTPIERIVLGGRSTHFCPKCQEGYIAPTNGTQARPAK